MRRMVACLKAGLRHLAGCDLGSSNGSGSVGGWVHPVVIRDVISPTLDHSILAKERAREVGRAVLLILGRMLGMRPRPATGA